nr:MAG TPA: hypothetical protein [Caudoviricetes sp.]
MELLIRFERTTCSLRACINSVNYIVLSSFI